MEIIYCRGGDKNAPHIAKMAGMLYGTRFDYTPYAPVYFVDAAFGDKVNWPKCIQRVQEWKPKLSLVPDYERCEQLPFLLCQIDELRALGVTPLVCPKFDGAVADIPAGCRVAISVPSETYAGFLPDDHEVIDRQLHLLGGSPAQQLYIIRHRYPLSTVVSVDGNKLAAKAGMGQVWIANQARWVQTPTNRASNYILERVSAMEITKYLRDPRSMIRTYQPSVKKCRARPLEQLDLIA